MDVQLRYKYVSIYIENHYLKTSNYISKTIFVMKETYLAGKKEIHLQNVTVKIITFLNKTTASYLHEKAISYGQKIETRAFIEIKISRSPLKRTTARRGNRSIVSKCHPKCLALSSALSLLLRSQKRNGRDSLVSYIIVFVDLIDSFPATTEKVFNVSWII